MTAPLVSTLPTAPSRLGKPSNFVTDSTVFLDSLSSYRTQTNQFASYINSQVLNKYNFGKLNGIRSFPSVSQLNSYDIEYTNNSVAFTSDLDVFYDDLHTHSTKVNTVGAWFDGVIGEIGTAPYDLDKPMVSGVTVPMNRGQGRDDFNEHALSFGESCTNNINSLYESIYHTYITSCADKNFGSITDTTIIKTIYCGSVVDTNLTY